MIVKPTTVVIRRLTQVALDVYKPFRLAKNQTKDTPNRQRYHESLSRASTSYPSNTTGFAVIDRKTAFCQRTTAAAAAVTVNRYTKLSSCGKMYEGTTEF